MPAYLIGRVKVNDPVEFSKYSERTPEIVRAHGGKVLAKAGCYRITEGTDKFHRFVVVEFPSFEAAERCIDSPEYQQAAMFRRQPGVGEIDQVILEAGEN